MKYAKLLLSIFCCALIVSACDSLDYGDINQDDDSISEANTKSLLAGAMHRFFSVSSGNYTSNPTLYVQYQSQATYTAEQRYGQSPKPWSIYYVDILASLDRVVEVNSAENIDDLTASYGSTENQIGVAELMSAFIWKRVTDTWGPIPYEEALSDSVITPAYSNQEVIYKDLITRVKEARDMLDPATAEPTADVVYGGDVTKWKKFANSFLLTLSLQLSNKYPSSGDYAATEFSAALNHSAGVIEDVEDEFWYEFQNTPGNTNPFSQFRGADYQIGLPFTSALRGTSNSTTYNGAPVIDYSNDSYDARLNVLSSDPDSSGRPYGREVLDDSNTPEGLTSTFASISQDIIGPAAPLPYMTAAYTYLNRAEAAEKGWTSESAILMLETGIVKSYESIDTHWDDGSSSSGDLQSDGTAFAAQRLADASIDQVIAEEKWVALFPMGFQAWSEWRRTDFPKLVPAVDAVNDGSIPTRYIYPQEESGSNGEAYDAGVGMLAPAEDGNTAKFWWDVD